MRTRASVLLVVAAMLAAAPSPGRAIHHLWRIDQVYSNSDRSVQYIRMWSGFNAEQFVAETQLRSLSTGRVFTFPHNLPSAATANRHILLATPAFTEMPGSVSPDYVLPAEFFQIFGDTIQYTSPAIGTLHSWTFSSMPTNGYHAHYRHQGTGPMVVVLNEPINFMGQAGALPIPGDANLDGIVNVSDLSILAANWQRSDVGWEQADFNRDGIVNVSDLSILASNWQISRADPDSLSFAQAMALFDVFSGVSIPEPGPLSTVGGSLLLLRRRIGSLPGRRSSLHRA